MRIETSPQDVGVFFEELWKGNIVKSENKEEILNFLTDTLYEDGSSRNSSGYSSGS
jgi:hypothetical protein